MSGTVRTHPRTMNEAFRKTAEYGCAIERQRKRAYSALNVVYVIAIVALILAVAFQGAPV